MVSKRTYVDHLRNVSMFAGFTRKELEKIASLGDVVSLPAGRTFIEEGREGREAFILLSGTVTVKRKGRRLNQLQPGAIIGELSLLDQHPRSATAVCDTDCTLLVLTRAALISAVADVPALAHKLLAALAARVRDLDTRSYG
jgi:CRP-like cAMP-binding protein